MASAINQVMAAMLGASRGSAESLLFDSINSTGQGAWSFGDTANSYHAGQQVFLNPSNITVTKIKVVLSAQGTISGKSFTVTIWTNSLNNLGSVVGTSDTVTGNNSWSLTTVTFQFSTPVSLSSGTNYNITVEPTGAFDGSNYAKAEFVNLNLIPGTLGSFSDAGVNQYPLSFTDYDLQIQIWGT